MPAVTWLSNSSLSCSACFALADSCFSSAIATRSTSAISPRSRTRSARTCACVRVCVCGLRTHVCPYIPTHERAGRPPSAGGRQSRPWGALCYRVPARRERGARSGAAGRGVPGGVLSEPVLKLGDVVAAEHRYGDSAVVLRRHAAQRRAGVAWLRAAQRRAARRLAELRSVLLLLVRELRRELLPALPCTAQLGLNSARHLTRRRHGHPMAARLRHAAQFPPRALSCGYRCCLALGPVYCTADRGRPAAGPLAAGSARLAVAAVARARRARWRAPAPPSPGTYKCNVRCNTMIQRATYIQARAPRRSTAICSSPHGERARRLSTHAWETVPHGIPCRKGYRAAAAETALVREARRVLAYVLGGARMRRVRWAKAGFACAKSGPAAAHARAARRRCAAQPARP